MVGDDTRSAITEYKTKKGLHFSSSLDFEEEYQLISSAKEKNDRNIEDTIVSLKSLGTKQETPTQSLRCSRCRVL